MKNVARETLVDAGYAFVTWLVASIVLFLLHPRMEISVSLALLIFFSAVMALPLAWRRAATKRAALTLAIIFAFQFVFLVPLIPANFTLVLMLHAIARYAPKTSRVALAVAVAGALIAVFRYESVLFVSMMTPVVRLTLWLLVSSLLVAAWLLGDTQRTRRALEKEYAEHALRTAREQLQERNLVAAEERARIAREMHDVIAHSLSVIITQADGARYANINDPEVAPAALNTISETARESLAEMRRLLGILRGGEQAQMGPAPGVKALPELIAEVQQAGLQVTFDIKNGGSAEPSRLPRGAGLAVYRAVQEALTNVIKHAGPIATATVVVEWEETGVVVAIGDDGRGAAADPPTTTGYGIKGMQERFALYNGTVVAQPKVGGGFIVHAWMPYAS